jgi:hypothetical protein
MTPYAISIEIVTTLLLGIRLTSRISKFGGQLGLDDILILIAWTIGFGMTVFIIHGKTSICGNLIAGSS